MLVPQRGDRKRLSDLAHKNAQVSFSTRRDAREDVEIMLAKLQKKLRLPKLPRVIECYDISHIQGFAPVASMVVFVDGRPDKARYRTYRVRGAEGATARAGNDDFASMYEVLSRRFRRARERDAGWELPDLIVIDGGKGQLGMALAAARDVGIDVRPGQGLPLVGLAKERDVDNAESETRATKPETQRPRLPQPGLKLDANTPPTEPSSRSRRRATADRSEKTGRRPDRIYLPHAKDAIPIRPNSAEMFVLQHLRDEAHRFAVTFHRRRRGNLTLRSALGDVPGIGPSRQRLLLRHFGSLKKIRDATVDELAGVAGMTAKAATAVVAHLGGVGADSGVAKAPPAEVPAAGPAESNASTTSSPPLSDDAEEDALESAFAEMEDDLDGDGDGDMTTGPDIPR